MKKREMKKFETLLLAERQRLSTGIQNLEANTLHQAAGDHVADVSSYAEVGTDNNERETALSIASGESEMLRNVSDALVRIQDGSYGKCEGCNEEIPKKRLEVFPAAKYCIECQAKFEKDGTLE